MRDRAESGRGRPWSEPSLKAVERLEADMRRMRKDKDYTRGEMIWICPVTRDALFVNYPVSYTPSQAMAEMLKIDTDHTHKAWETFSL